jgi:putative hydrolase of the HAD superfamily
VSARAVLFDAGNTLVFLDYPRLARAVGEATGLPLTAPALSAQAGPAALALERGDGTDRERASRYLEQLFLLAGVPVAQLELVRDTLLELHRQKHLWGEMQPGTPEGLDRLREAGYRLGVVSNSDGRVEEALAAAGIRDRFEVVIDSQLVGMEKPDPRIFALALERLGMASAEALYVGDTYEVDVIGARRAGLEVVLLDPLGRHGGRDVPTAASVAHATECILDGSLFPDRQTAEP